MADYTDYVAEQEAIKRRQKLLEAMQAQSMQAPIVGNTGLGQALAKIATSYVQGNRLNELDQQSQDNSRASQADLASQLKDYLETTQGKKGTNISEGPPTEATFNTGDNAILGVPDQFVGGTPADPKAAVLKALASQHPEMKAIGASGYKELTPRVEKVGDKLIEVALGKDPRVLGSYSKPIVVGNQGFDINGATPQPVIDAREKYGPVEKVADGPSGPVFGQREPSTGKVHFAPGGVNVNNSQNQTNALEKVLVEKIPGVLDSARKEALSAQNQIASANRIMELVKDPQVITGFGADQLTGLASLGAKLGLTGPQGLMKSQELVAEMSKQTLANVHLLPGAITEKERPFLQEAAAGRITWTPEAIQHLAELSAATAHNSLMAASEQYHKASEQYPQFRSLAPFPQFQYKLPDSIVPESDNSPRVTVRGSSAPATAQPAATSRVLTFEEALKRARGGR